MMNKQIIRHVCCLPCFAHMMARSGLGITLSNVCFSNLPGGVKRFQTIHDCGIDVTRGLVLLYGIGT